MKVLIASDKTGAHLASVLLAEIRGLGREALTIGVCVSCDEGLEYPDIARTTAKRIATGDCDRAILICGTGLGVAMMANKALGVWAGTCSDPEQARRLASSNGAQVLCIGCEIVSTQKAKKIARAYLETPLGDRPNARRMRELEGQP